ncbi:MAG: universal stress protein [Candidatus Sumerlaeia bacterium]|nr:universal stress protein [Candidatus Sumerlaeia bacterium]
MASEPEKSFTILSCLALSPRAAAVAGEALALGRRLGGEVVFVHAGPEDAEQSAAVEAVLREASGPGAPAPRFFVRDAAPEDAAAEVAEEVDADLVVAGALEREGLMEGFFGSIARRIARRVPRSVLLLPAPVTGGRPFRTVVVSVAFDDASRAMVAFAAPFARRAGATELHFIYETDSYDRLAGRVRASEGPDPAEEAGLLRAAHLVELRHFIEDLDLSGIEVEVEVLEGAEGLESVDYARRVGADLLVYPAPSRPLRFWDRFLKHPTEVVLERLPCAVLVHRGPGAPEVSPR